RVERRNGNHLGAKLQHCIAKRVEVLKAGEDGEVDVAAELSGAVRHARLPAHEQCSDAVRAHRRKDSEYRARDQASLPAPGTTPKVCRSRAIVRPASSGTTPPTPVLRCPRHECAARLVSFARAWLRSRAIVRRAALASRPIHPRRKSATTALPAARRDRRGVSPPSPCGASGAIRARSADAA